MRLVLFDIDGTLVRGPSTERRFYRYLWRRGAQGPRQLFGSVTGLFRGLLPHKRHVLKKNKGYLGGLEVYRVESLAEDWAETELASQLYDPALERLRWHQSTGDHVVLLSGTPDFLAEAIAAKLDVSYSIGSAVRTRHDRYCAHGLRRHPFGAEKRNIASALARQWRLAPADVVAYADSVYDLPLLNWAGQAVAVRPDRRLAAVAGQKRWLILDQPADRSAVPLAT